MNRDERLTRVEARPPEFSRIGNRRALFPSEPNGGTWIGVNDAGITFALINWYSVPSLPCAASRGKVVRSLLAAHSLPTAREMLGVMPLARINPFRVVGVFRKAKAVVEWRWNTQVLECISHPWRANIWISSGYDEPGAQQTRARTFAEALQQPSVGTLGWLRRLHRSHSPESGPYSICMHRSDAATISYTDVSVFGLHARMRYQPVRPCCQTGSRRLFP